MGYGAGMVLTPGLNQIFVIIHVEFLQQKCCRSLIFGWIYANICSTPDGESVVWVSMYRHTHENPYAFSMHSEIESISNKISVRHWMLHADAQPSAF